MKQEIFFFPSEFYGIFYVTIENSSFVYRQPPEASILSAHYTDTAISPGTVTPESVREALLDVIAGALRLNRDQIDPAAPFLEMGMNSIALIEALRVVNERFGVRPSMRKVFEKYQTVDLLSKHICELVESGDRRFGPNINAGALENDGDAEPAGIRIPLTEAQRQAWFLSRYSDGASAAQHEAVLVRLNGELKTAALTAAFQNVVTRHAALRARVLFDEEAQRISPASEIGLKWADLEPAAAAGAIADEVGRPFELEEPLARATVFRLDSREYVLALVAHGLIADRPALQLAAAEIAEFYSANVSGRAARLDPPMSFGHYVDRLAAHEGSPEYREASRYWLDQYSGGIPALDLPSTNPRPAVKSYRGARVVLPLDAGLIGDLEARAKEQASTLFTILLAAFQVFIHRLTGAGDLVVGIFGNSAPVLSGSESLIANAVNPLPLRTSIDSTSAFRTFAGELRTRLLDALDRQDLPFAALVRQLAPPRDQSRSPIFTVAFGMESTVPPPRFDGLSSAWMTAPVQHARYDLHCTVVQSGGAFQLQCDYSTDLFDAPAMRRLVRNFRVLLESIAADPGETIARLPLLSADERRQIVETWNQTWTDYPREFCVHELFEQQAAQTPDAPAVTFEDCTLSYAELNRRANQIANRLRRLGVGPDTCVGVCAHRSNEAIIAFLAINKAGGAYMPLDPTYPRERLAFMVNESGAKVALAQHALISKVSGLASVFALDGEPDIFVSEPGTNPPNVTTPRNLVYVIYTSGSTGRPKGVPVEHRGVVRLVRNSNFANISASDRVLQFCAFTFDVATFEIWGALLNGGHLVLGPAHLQSLEQLGNLIVRRGVTTAWLTSGLFHQMVDNQLHSLVGVRQMLAGGDVVSPPHARKVLSLPGERRMINGYGPTENTTFTSCHVMTEASQVGPSVSIGRPISNSTIYILDANMQVVPIGVPGELYSGGDGVARGYLSQPLLTAERFVKDPFSSIPGATLYRTGDLARWLPDGTIEFLGRVDRQVKIRGYRIELEEVEVTLGRHPGVRDVSVIVREDVPGDKRLVAYFVPNEPAPNVSELRAFLADTVPPYMIPAAFVVMQSLPLTSAGKVNRAALPVPGEENRARSTRSWIPPQTPTEEVLARIWAEALSVERVGVNDDFFELGGHSMLLTKLLLRVRRFFQVKLTLTDFFISPTIRDMARLIGEAHHSEKPKTNSSLYDPDGSIARARFEILERDALLDDRIFPAGVAAASASSTLITGATGYIGTHIIRELLERTNQTLYCLVRASDAEEGKQKLIQRMKRMDLHSEERAHRLVAVPGDVSLPRLGLTERAWNELAGTVDAVIHGAAMVNFIYPYEALKKTNVEGMRQIISFACQSRTKLLHLISSTGIWPMGTHRVFREDSPIDQGLLLNLGYDDSKWVQERMLQRAQSRGLPAIVYRPGEVSGHSQTGRINADEHFAFALLKGCLQLGAFPPIDCFVDLSPVDYVGKVIAHISQQSMQIGGVFHITNPSPMHSTDVFAWFESRGYKFDILPVREWMERLSSSADFTRNALYPYMTLLEEFGENNFQLPRYECQGTVAALDGSDISCPPVDGRLLGCYTDYLTGTGFLPAPDAAAHAVGAAL